MRNGDFDPGRTPKLGTGAHSALVRPLSEKEVPILDSSLISYLVGMAISIGILGNDDAY